MAGGRETEREVVELAGERASEAGSSRSRRSQSLPPLLVSLYGRPDFRKSHNLKLDSIPTFIFSTSHTYTHIYTSNGTHQEGRTKAAIGSE